MGMCLQGAPKYNIPVDIYFEIIDVPILVGWNTFVISSSYTQSHYIRTYVVFKWVFILWFDTLIVSFIWTLNKDYLHLQ